jgi:hypothetical protein
MTTRWMPPTPEEVRQAVEVAIADLEVMEREIESEQSEATYARLLRAEFWGIRAATRKRLAEVEFLYGGDWRRTLRAALRDYETGMQQGVQVDHWILGQYVVLKYLLVESGPERSTTTDREPFEFWWYEARRSVKGALHGASARRRMWAHSTMADLLMVSLAMPATVDDFEIVQPRDVINELEQMIAAAGGEDDCPALWPTFRQFWRWRFWWTNPAWEDAAQLGYDYLWSLVEPRLHLEPETVAPSTIEPAPPSRVEPAPPPKTASE